MTEQIILAVDGGATKTTLVIKSESGKTFFEKTVTSTNYQAIGQKNAERTFVRLLSEAYDTTKITNIDIAIFAISGIDTKYDLQIVKQIIHNAISKVPFHFKEEIIENDVEATLIGLTQGTPGALIIAGTGAICYGTDGDTFVRTGGFGHRAGDEGSGYWIGQQILRTVFKHVDGRIKYPTILKDFVYSKLQISHVDELINWLFHPSYTNAQIASIATILQTAVVHGDEEAIRIATDAAKELALLATTTIEKVYTIDSNIPFTVYVNGGVLKNNSVVYKLFKQFCMQKYPTISFVLCNDPPIDYIVKRALYKT